MVRVLLCGDLRGRLPQLRDHISRLHAKLPEAQHFKAVFCVGEFSSEDMDLDVDLPVATYFIDAGPAAGDLISESPQGEELQPNLNFLGHYGVAKVEGLSVAFLSGRYRQDLFPPDGASADTGTEETPITSSWEELRAAEKKAEEARTQLYVDGCYYTPLAIERLIEEIGDSNGVDLLLTSEWPAGCFRGVAKEKREGVDKATYQRNSSAPVAKVAVAAEPKYHAVGLSSVFWRRPPWTHERRGEVVASTGELRCGACRMVALGAADGGASNDSAKQPPQKWLHGLDLDPDAIPAPADDATRSPWSEEALRIEAAKKEDPNKDAPPLRLGLAACLEGEDKRRWLQRFGCLPTEMQSASDKIQRELEPKEKEKKEKRTSIYWNQKSDKRFKAGKGHGDSFHQKERRAATGRSAGTF